MVRRGTRYVKYLMYLAETHVSRRTARPWTPALGWHHLGPNPEQPDRAVVVEAVQQVERCLGDHGHVIRWLGQGADPGHGEEGREPQLEVDPGAAATLTLKVLHHLVGQRTQCNRNPLGAGEVALVRRLVAVPRCGCRPPTARWSGGRPSPPSSCGGSAGRRRVACRTRWRSWRAPSCRRCRPSSAARWRRARRTEARERWPPGRRRRLRTTQDLNRREELIHVEV